MLDQIRVTKKKEEDRLRQALMGLDERSGVDKGERTENVSPFGSDAEEDNQIDIKPHDGPLNLRIEFDADADPNRGETNVTPIGIQRNFRRKKKKKNRGESRPQR